MSQLWPSLPRWVRFVMLPLLLVTASIGVVQIRESSYPLSLSTFFLVLAGLLLQPAVAKSLGPKSKLLSTSCLVLSVAVVIGFWLARQPEEDYRAGNPQEAVVLSANEATAEFHRAVSEQRYGDVCTVSEQGAFQTVTELRCEEFLAYVHQRLGSFQDAAATGPAQVETNNSTPYVALEYTSRYAEQEAKESFVWHIRDAQGEALLTSYDIEAEALSR